MSYPGYEYPTEEVLQLVTAWRCEWLRDGTVPVYAPWFSMIKALWWSPDWGWSEYEGSDDGDPIRVYCISTGGWSGNESLISAMRENFIAWHQTFHTNRRGGHFEFWIPRVEALSPEASKAGCATPVATAPEVEIKELRDQLRTSRALVQEVVKEMRTVQMVAGQAALEIDDRDTAAAAALESERLRKWADKLASLFPEEQ